MGDELTELARQALEDDEHNAPGPWEAKWTGTLRHTNVYSRGGAPIRLNISIARSAGDIPPEGKWIAAARTREPMLARGYLDAVALEVQLREAIEELTAYRDTLRRERDEARALNHEVCWRTGCQLIAERDEARAQVAALRELLRKVTSDLRMHADKFAAEGKQSERHAEENNGPGAAVELERAYVCNTAALRMREVAALASPSGGEGEGSGS